MYVPVGGWGAQLLQVGRGAGRLLDPCSSFQLMWLCDVTCKGRLIPVAKLSPWGSPAP